MKLRKAYYHKISSVSIALVSALLFLFPSTSESNRSLKQNPSSFVSRNPSSQIIFESEYNDLLNISLEIFTRFPPDQYFILGIGEVPTVLLLSFNCLIRNTLTEFRVVG